MIERMFGTVPLDVKELAAADDAAVVSAIEGWARWEAQAGARRLAAIAELTRRRCDAQGKRKKWACDGWDHTAAEVAAAARVSPKKASWQMSLAMALRVRLPLVGELYLWGLVSWRVVSAIAWHTLFVEDLGALVRIDSALAERAIEWGVLSDYKLSQAIEVWVHHYDPEAVRRSRGRMAGRDFTVGRKDEDGDVTAVWGRLLATDAAVLHRRLQVMVDGVCEHDPRSAGQRRADALGALAAGAERLACGCGRADCAAVGNDGRAANVTIHVIAPVSSLHPDPGPDPGPGPGPDMNGGGDGGGGGPDDPEPPTGPDPAPLTECEPPTGLDPAPPTDCDPPADPGPPAGSVSEPAVGRDLEPVTDGQAEGTPRVDRSAGVDHRRRRLPAPAPGPSVPAGWLRQPGLLGRDKIVPAGLLAGLIRSGAKVSVVRKPGPVPEAGYRPSAKLAEFVRCRDVTCRFPGCEEPAEFCDLDHTIVYAGGGLTHASNLKCLCRKHHLLKTFWPGWTDEQFPDGTVEWTTPTGHTYTTLPGSRTFFPGWDTTTAALPPPSKPDARTSHRTLMMPTRRRSRAADHANRITQERKLNAAAIAAETEQADNAPSAPTDPEPYKPPDPHDFDDDPPPF